jgi:hypothetical protein
MEYTIRFQRIVVVVMIADIAAMVATESWEMVICSDELANLIICGEDI